MKTAIGDPPTFRQAEILGYIRDCQSDNGAPPTIREIGLAFGIRSPNGVKCHLNALVKKGLVRLNGKGTSRGYVALPTSDPDAPCCPTCGRPRPEQGARA